VKPKKNIEINYIQFLGLQSLSLSIMKHFDYNEFIKPYHVKKTRVLSEVVDYLTTYENVPNPLLFSDKAEIFKQSLGARNQGVIGLSYRPARLHRLAEFIPWNRFLGSINV
jgi:hypothetical protein